MKNHEFKNSSSLQSCHYDDKNNILYIQFQSGHTHLYADCPKQIHDALIAAESPGKFFHAHIRDKYESQRC